jgi:hypothetical protein
MLHSPFAQQHPPSSSLRPSPFQQTATAGSLHGLQSNDIEASWVGPEYGRRQRFLDVFEPMGAAARSSSVQHRDQDQQVSVVCLRTVQWPLTRCPCQLFLCFYSAACAMHCTCSLAGVASSQCSAHTCILWLVLHSTAPRPCLCCCTLMTS